MRLNLNAIDIDDEQSLEQALQKVTEQESSPRSTAKQGWGRGNKETRQPLTPERQELHRFNQGLSAVELIKKLRTELPDVCKLATVERQWVWITFDQKPHRQVLEKLYDLGFNWGRRRRAWYNSCGTRGNNGTYEKPDLGGVPPDEFDPMQHAQQPIVKAEPKIAVAKKPRLMALIAR